MSNQASGEMQENGVRHILNLSGGKDSTALAVFMRDKVPAMEYVFCDTGCELQETYEYLDKIETFLGKQIVRLNSDQPFDHWLEIYSGYLPSARSRWCTRVMKLVPFERYVGNDTIYSYVGIRADEDREGYISGKANITPVYPFKEAGITEKDVYEILNTSGLGLPKYYEWRSRSGCYFCFFQRRNEWVGLLEKHPDLFYKAKTYEKTDPASNQKFTWVQNTTLGEIERDKDKIKERIAKLQKPEHEKKRLYDLYEEFSTDRSQIEDDPGDACLICHL
jgi:3'-phosphoadenosine 5'-phosphosulfate sulfotransferase (PAPS reductase)/FAD synthetase